MRKVVILTIIFFLIITFILSDIKAPEIDENTFEENKEKQEDVFLDDEKEQSEKNREDSKESIDIEVIE